MRKAQQVLALINTINNNMEYDKALVVEFLTMYYNSLTRTARRYQTDPVYRKINSERCLQYQRQKRLQQKQK